MKAAVVQDFNEINIEEKEKPQLGEEEALIRVTHMGICGSDVHLYQGKLAANYPIVPGHEFSGYLEKINSQKYDYKPGQKVVAHPLTACGVCDLCKAGRENACKDVAISGIHKAGGFAEYIKVPAGKIYPLPKDMDLKLSALLEPLAVAVHDVRRSEMQIGQTVYIIGGGPIGILTAIVAKAAGASRVVVGEFNNYRIGFMRSLGIEVADLNNTTLEEVTENATGGKGFDIVFEDSGAAAAYVDMVNVAARGGTIMLIGMPSKKQLVDITECAKKELRLIGCRIHSESNYAAALEVMKSGEYNGEFEKLITHTFPFAEISDAMKFAVEDTKHVKIVLEMQK